MTPPERRMLMYSGHDTTISSFLNSLGLFSPPISPPYAALVAIELRRLNKDRYISITYRNDTSAPPYVLQIPGCQANCPLDDFDRLTKRLRPDDWRAECGLPDPDSYYDHTAQVVTVASVAVASVLASLLCLVACVSCVKRKCVRDESGRGYASLNQDVA